ncbi:hypothetical protein INR49_019340 [Caranx melampygus]|nr:hypothetical protein INR49_019340 [Caranx melampygus]
MELVLLEFLCPFSGRTNQTRTHGPGGPQGHIYLLLSQGQSLGLITGLCSLCLPLEGGGGKSLHISPVPGAFPPPWARHQPKARPGPHS